jgi:glycosidase
MRRLFSLLAVTLLIAIPLLTFTDRASMATFRNRVAQVPATPTSAQSVRVWMQSDTVFGETAGIEYKIGNTYVKVLGSFDTSGPAPANWRADIPAQPHGTFVEYQLFTRNQFGQDYGFTGFNWSYTVNNGDIQWFGLRHDTFDAYYRSPFGAVAAGTPVTLRFRTDHFDVSNVFVRVYTYNPATDTTAGPVDHPMTFLENRTEGSTLYDIWTLTLATPSAPAILYYKFRITDATDEDFYSDAYADDHDNLNQGGEGAASDNEPFPAFQITAYDPNFQTPAWLQSANVYHIFPDRFRNGEPLNDYCRPGSSAGCPSFYDNQTPLLREPWNVAIGDPRQPGQFQGQYGTQFYGGDLQGIENQLDYLQGLGVDTIYLNPIFKARSNHRYDTDNFLEVDPALGGDAALASLKTEMERRGMRLILDGVFNHSSSDSVYFDRYQRYGPPDSGCENASSPYRSWYNFFNNNAPCTGADYEGWFGFDSLAVFRDNSTGVRDFFYRTPGTNVTQYWYERGASGWRFDVANEISHNWWHEYRPLAKGYKSDGPLIGEIWPDASQWLAGDQLDSVMNYRFRKNVLGFARGIFDWGDNDNFGNNRIEPLSPSQFDRALRSVREDYPAQATAAMLNLIDSHDTNRALYVLTFLGDNGLVEAKERLKLAALFQFTYLGAPMIYYGDEGALNSPSLASGPNGPEDDPYNRAPFPWADQDGDQNVYGPVDSNVQGFYTTLAHMRKQHAALRTGSFETLLTGDTTPSTTDNSTYAFARAGNGETAIVVLNNGAGSNAASLPVGAYFADGMQLQDALSGATYTVNSGQVNLTLAARSGAVLFNSAFAAVDTTAPVASASVTPPANAEGWHNSSPITVNLSAIDGGSGIKELRYWVNGGSVTVVSNDAASLAVSTEGTTNISVRAIDNAGNISDLAAQEVKIDLTDPTVSCPTLADATVNADCQAAVPDVTPGVMASDNLTPTASLVITQSPAAGTLVGPGTHAITVTVTDLAGNSNTCSTDFEVTDNTPPVITAPPDVTVNSGATSCSAFVSNTTLGAAQASDNCEEVSITRAGVPAGNNFPVGETLITYTATAENGQTAMATQKVTVIDATAPTITGLSANPSTLSPPNHQMRDVTLSYNEADNCGGPLTCTVSVSSNEPVSGSGDGDAAPDWEEVDSHHVRLRAERAGVGVGRIYTVTITCTDAMGNSASQSVTVSVPKGK